MKRGLPLIALLASLGLHIAVAAALMLAPTVAVKIDIPPVIQLVKLAPPMPEPVAVPPQPAPAKPPPRRPAAKPQPRPKPEPVAKPGPRPLPAPEPVEVLQPEPIEAPVEKVVEAPPEPAAPQPVYRPVNVQAAYLSNPRPPYPRMALRRGWEGVVVLQIDLDKQGQPLRVEVADSSGHRVLDKAAQAAVRRWRFAPATRDGKAVAARNLRVPIQFRLKDA